MCPLCRWVVVLAMWTCGIVRPSRGPSTSGIARPLADGIARPLGVSSAEFSINNTILANRHNRVNPATLAVSGYVFCYPCIFNWVAQRRCCPVTRQPATLDHVRRLFEAL